MNEIGMTMKYGLFTSWAHSPGEQALLDAWGGAEEIMAGYQRLGVSSIELSAVHTGQELAQTLDICRRILRAGLHLTLHGTTENISGKAHFAYYLPLYEEMLKYQPDIKVTLHSLADRTLAASIFRDWCEEAEKACPPLRFMIENQRVKQQDIPHFRIDGIPPILPDAPNVGICWDMGHYAYNVLKKGMPGETLPAENALRRVEHTHIHSVVEMDTHYPLRGEPVNTYVQALRINNYQGLYNLEIVPDRFMRLFPDVRHEIEQSILDLKEMIRA